MKKWTTEEEFFLQQNIGNLSYKQIAVAMDRTRRSVIGHCRQMGLSNSLLRERTQFKKKYKVDEDFFSCFNILSCYYAGLLASDGCIGRKNNTVSITQSKNRLACLEKFKKDVAYTGVIYGPIKTKGQDAYSLVISSKKWKEDLKNNFKITPCKSLTLVPPDLGDKKMIISFITGLIDGDGSVGAYNYKNKKDIVPIITFCGTKDIVQWVRNILDKYFLSLTSRSNPRLRQITPSNTYFLSFSGRRVIEFYQYLIKNNIPFLFCKWEKMIIQISVRGMDYYLQDKRALARRDKNGRFCKTS